MKKLIILAFFLIGFLCFISANNLNSTNENNETDNNHNYTIVDSNETQNDSDYKNDTLDNRTREQNRERKELRKAEKERIKEMKELIKQHKGWINIEGRNISVRELSNETKEIIAGKINAKTGLNLTVEDINSSLGYYLKVYMSNGRHANIKIMPDKAAAKALERIRSKCGEPNCSIELKEVGSGNRTTLVYEIKTEKDARLFLFFKKKIRVVAEVNAETGEIVAIRRPWWAFLAKEKNETPDVVVNETASS